MEAEKVEKKKIAVIGAGVSGLVACKYAMEKGFSPIVFEAKNSIGGVWSKTIDSTKLQTPKSFYQFSDFPWPPSITESFPHHNQVMEYLQSYAIHFDILPLIKFNSKVINIDYLGPSDETMASWDLWGGTGDPFSASRNWNVTIKNTQDPTTKVYRFDFVMLCIGMFSDLPNVPEFPMNKGPEVFQGKVLHSMDYASMDNNSASELIREKLVTIVGCRKSAVDIAAEIAKKNGARHPCTLLFRAVHWMVPDYILKITFRNLNRFSEFMVHKPGEGFFSWLVAITLAPLLYIFGKMMESFLTWTFPLKKYEMIPAHSFLEQIFTCMSTVLPANFYNEVKAGSLLLKKSEKFSFWKKGLVIDGEVTPRATDVVIFATGYKSDEKLKNIFSSNYLKKCISGSSAPFYRECIHPWIPNLAILGYTDSPSVLYAAEMRSRWISHLFAGNFRLPTIREMEAEMIKWEKCMQRYAGRSYKRYCASVLLQIYCNDQFCNDIGYNPRRKKWLLSELFASYGPMDYQNLELSL